MYCIYENKFREAVEHYQAQVQRVEQRWKAQLQEMGEDDAQKARRSEAEREMQATRRQIEQQAEFVKAYYLEAIEKNLQQVHVDPNLLDVMVTLVIPSRNQRVESVYLKPFERISSIENQIRSIFQKQNNQVLEIDGAKVKLLFVDYEDNLRVDPQLLKDLEAHSETLKQLCPSLQVHSLQSESLIGQLSLKPRTVLYVVGPFALKSDQPAECMTYKFDHAMKLDYYSCATCGINCNPSLSPLPRGLPGLLQLLPQGPPDQQVPQPAPGHLGVLLLLLKRLLQVLILSYLILSLKSPQ